LPVIEDIGNGAVLNIRVIPRASKPGVAGTRDDALLVRLAAPPVEGAANAELIELLASLLNISRRQITLVAGAHSRRKRVKITGLNAKSIAVTLALGVS
jgi:uncharacterized protein (TIGR00251 family)